MTKLSGIGGPESTFGLSDFLIKVKAAGAGDVLVTFQNLITALLASGAFGTAVTSYTNAGTAGGTFNYINLGGIKLLWGQSAATSQSNSTSVDKTITLPVSFFTTVQTVVGTVVGPSNTSYFVLAVSSLNATTITINITNQTGGTLTTGGIGVLAIGT